MIAQQKHVGGTQEEVAKMFMRKSVLFRCGAFALGLAALPLAGCSSAGMGSFGSSKQQVADLAPNQSYTPDGALLEARTHFKNNNFGYSAAYFKKAVELSPKNSEAYVGLAASYDQLGRFDLSDRVYSALHKMSGDTAQYYNNIGYSHLLRGNLKSALRAFRRAADLAPDNVIIANNIQLLSDAVDAASA